MKLQEKLQLLNGGMVEERGVVIRVDFAANASDYVGDGTDHIYGLVTGITSTRLYIDTGVPQPGSPSLNIAQRDIGDITFVSLGKFAQILNILG